MAESEGRQVKADVVSGQGDSIPGSGTAPQNGAVYASGNQASITNGSTGNGGASSVGVTIAVDRKTKAITIVIR